MEGPAPNVVRRSISSDNSCLFNAIGYVMERNRNIAEELREVVSETVRSDPITYTEAFLEVPNEEYCEWILGNDSWGGAIELSILAGYYEREIASYDIRTRRCVLYGQDGGYTERVMLLYNGLHYDALAVSPSIGMDEAYDQTIFPILNDRTIGAVEDLALDFVVQTWRNAMNVLECTPRVSLTCKVCQVGVSGQKEAIDHAEATGHKEFQKYKY